MAAGVSVGEVVTVRLSIVAVAAAGQITTFHTMGRMPGEIVLRSPVAGQACR